MSPAAANRSPLLLIALVAAGIALLAIAGWFLFGREGTGGGSEERTVEGGGSGGSADTGGMQSFIIGSWGQDNDCTDRFTFEAGGRLSMREGDGTWSLRRENGRDILVAELGGRREEGEIERRGDGFEVRQTGGDELVGSYTRCTGAGAEREAASSGSSGGNMAMPTSTDSRATAMRSLLVGFWSLTGCADGLRLNADGTFSNRHGQSGTWSVGMRGDRTVLIQTAGGGSLTEYVNRIADDMVRVSSVDGSAPDVIIHRC